MTLKLVCDATAIKTPMTGVQVAVLQQVKALIEALPKNVSPVILARDDSTLPAELRLSPPECTRSPLVRALWQQFTLPKLLKKLDADLLHAFAYTAPRACPVPYILNVHDVIALEHPELCSFKNRLHMAALLPSSIKNAKLNLVSTKHGADLLMSMLNVPPANIEVVSLGVDVDFFATPSPYPEILNTHCNQRPYLLFVSNIEPKKDLDTLLDAYALCADTLQVDLVVVGRPAWKSKNTQHRLETWNAPGHVHWLKYVPKELLPALYQHALLFVMPSITEGFGLPVLEAMAAGTPVIHSDHPALCESAGNAGISFQRHNPQDLAHQLQRLAQSNDLRQDRIQAGKSHAASRTWKRWGEFVAQRIL